MMTATILVRAYDTVNDSTVWTTRLIIGVPKMGDRSTLKDVRIDTPTDIINTAELRFLTR
jgi:hypothetical protein